MKIKTPLSSDNTILHILDELDYFRLGFLGNQPFSTRLSCSNSSFMLQKQEKPATPRREEKKVLCRKNAIIKKSNPAMRKTG